LSFEDLTERELHIVSCVAKYIKGEVDGCMGKEDGWEKLMKELDEVIRIADSGLVSSLINKLYRTNPF